MAVLEISRAPASPLRAGTTAAALRKLCAKQYGSPLRCSAGKANCQSFREQVLGHARG